MIHRRHLMTAFGAASVTPYIRPAGAQTLTRATLRLKWLAQTQLPRQSLPATGPC